MSVEPCGGLWCSTKPYRGAAQVLNDLIPGRVDCYFASGALLDNMRSGQIRGLGVTSAKRDPAALELPAIADTVPGYEASSWHALFVPAKTPAEIVKKMSADTIAALADPAVKQKLMYAGGYVAMSSSAAELEALFKSDIEKWAAVIKAAAIKIN
jgi:tripartite-type tricarboxylate transporter receptor subunit TctC